MPPLTFECRYPQMGGYVSYCDVTFEPAPGNVCFTAAVYHDGEFPFARDGESPTHLHHCDAAQFVEFGVEVMEQMAESGQVSVSATWRADLIARLNNLPTR